MSTLFQDFRYALRQLIKSPGFTLTAVLSLTLGIGATTAVFSIVHAVLMNPYPYAAPDRMVHMRLKDKSGRDVGFGLTGPQYQALRQSPVVESAFMEEDWNLTVTGHDLPEDVNGVYLTSNSFEHLGVPAALGRGLISADAIDGQDPQPVVVLGFKFWQRHFDADPKVLGQTLQLVRKNYTIVGVAAQRFTWGDGDVFLPLKVTQDPTKADYVGLRLKPGVTHQAAVAALTPMILQYAKDTPKHFPTDHFDFVLVGLNEDFVKQIGGALYLLFGAVAFLLLIGCSNVSILLMARGTSRQHELAVRMAIGATRGRVIRQLLTEALILSLTGAAMGVLLAYKLLAVIVGLLPQYSFPHEAAIQINLPVLFFSVVVALLTGVLFGLWPALQLSRPDVGQVMQAGTRKIAGSISGKATNNLLIGGQIALTLVMLAAAGAAIQGFLKLMHTSLGYDPHNVMSVGIPVHDGTYKTWASRSAYFEQLRARVSTVPGVKMTAISSNATPPSNGFPTPVEFLGKPAQDAQKVLINVVSPSYFPLLRVPKMQGRIWDETEDRNGARVTVINETMARLYFPKGDAVGHSMKIPALKEEPPYTLMAPGGDDWLQIVGIVGDKKDDGLMKPVAPEAFVPSTLTMRMYTQILVRSDVSPLTLLHAIGAQISAVDADQQVTANVQDLDHWISGEQYWQQQRLVAWLFGAFAVLALSLAAVGLYSVVSYTVAQRTSEFGIRMALGAQREHVLRIVFQSTATSVVGGIAVGLALTIVLQRLMAHWSEGSSRDPLILLGVLLVLSAVALIACAVPARRASLVDPVTALRN